MLAINLSSKVISLLAIIFCLSFYVGAGGSKPIAVDDIIKVKEGIAFDFDPTTNDIDSDSDQLKLLAIHTKPAHGTVYKKGKSVKYISDRNYCGMDSFTYYVGDTNGNKNIGKVNIAVSCTNSAPIANPDIMALKKNNRALLNPLTNDTDSEGDKLYLHSIKSQPEHGVADIVNSYVQYTPNQDFCGTDVFSYNVNDSHANQSFALVSITVLCLKDI
jgi:hypothetical protein